MKKILFIMLAAAVSVVAQAKDVKAAPVADFAYGVTRWSAPKADEMTITVPAHKAGSIVCVEIGNVTKGAKVKCVQGGVLSGNTLEITAPAPNEQVTAVVSVKKGKTAVNYSLCVNTEQTLQKLVFDPSVRYSQLIIDNNIDSFYANTGASGINSKPGQLDYVPGLVAKAVIEAVDYYKDHTNGVIDAAKVGQWYKAVEDYGNNHTIKKAGIEGKSFDDLNAVKLYFNLRSIAQSPMNGLDVNSSTIETANGRIAATLKGIQIANEKFAIGEGFPKDMQGGWWHKAVYENQMWCDGQYMGTALLAQLINDKVNYDAGDAEKRVSEDDWALVYKQMDISYRYLWNDETKLLHHAFAADNGVAKTSSMWEFDKDAQGNNRYRNSACWGRAAGWYFLALVDVLEQMEIAGHTGADYQKLKGYLGNIAAGLKARQDEETGCWYQLPEYDGTFSSQDYPNGAQNPTRVYNYLESSATAIFTASFLKAMRLGYISKQEYVPVVKKAYKGFVENFINAGDYKLYWCSRSAGLGIIPSGAKLRTGSPEYYLQGFDVVPTKITDSGQRNEPDTNALPKGTEGKVLGAFIMAATEYERMFME